MTQREIEVIEDLQGALKMTIERTMAMADGMHGQISGEWPRTCPLCEVSWDQGEADDHMEDCPVSLARAAIAKAEGEEPAHEND